MMAIRNSGVSRKGAALVVLTGLGLAPAHADHVQMESAVVESGSGKTSSVSRSDGSVATFFTMQKKLVYDTLQGMGIPLESLPPDVRTRLSQFHTQNFEAFRAFASGLNAQDEGRFAEAKAFFQRATELDPAFSMAREMEVAMPQSDTRNALQLQAVLRDAVKSATQGGKDSVAVDVAHALAAMQSGMTVTVGQAPAVAPEVSAAANATENLSNPPGSGDRYGAHAAVGISYEVTPVGASVTVGVASTTEWSASQVVRTAAQLTSLGSTNNFVAAIYNASPFAGADSTRLGSSTLSDGTVVNWGSWSSTAGHSAQVKVSDTPQQYPVLGAAFNYMMANATPSMPTAGLATFAPLGGNFTNTSGTISTDFGSRSVTLNGLGFTLGNYTFSGLTGQTTYATTGSGFFSGNYSGGGCQGCSNFSATGSAFTGNFVGSSANGLIFSSILKTGDAIGNVTVSGVHLFTR